MKENHPLPSGLPEGQRPEIGLAPAHLELLAKLGDTVPRSLDIPSQRRIFVNRGLPMADVELIGFDMDYTLALYNQHNLERLSIECTIKKLIEKHGYPDEIRSLEYEQQFAVRGLVVDRNYGNVLKMDRFGQVERVYHGRRLLGPDDVHMLYQTERIRLSHPRYAWIDTLFALPEAVMYARLVAFFDEREERIKYGKLWQDIRDSIDEAHRDDSLKSVIRRRLSEYILSDPDLASTLHKFRSAGKRIFLLTNSAWDYTDAVMRYLLDGVLSAYPSWRNFFDIVVVSGQKPAFFTEKNPFLELDPNGQVKGVAEGQFQRGRIYQGGNIADFEAMAGQRGNRVLYIGDHIYGDMLRAKKSSVWRTAMVVQELEREVELLSRHADELKRIETLERQCTRLDPEITYQQQLVRMLSRVEDGNGIDRQVLDRARQEAKRRLDELRTSMKQASTEMSVIDERIYRDFNPYWGAIFRAGLENSRFGQQVEDYACVYTSRVSNFLAYSPLRNFRSPRDFMSHENQP